MTKSKMDDIDIAKKLVQLQQSAASRNLEFNLTFKTVKRLMTVKRCYYTEVPFEDEGSLARSIDRVDTNRGYVEGNVVACTIDINGKKSNLSNADIEMLYKKITKFYSKK
jgi:ribosome-interacting GTPase 1